MLAEDPLPTARAASAAAPATTSGPSTSASSSAAKPERESLQSRFNDLVHEDYISDIFYYIFWGGFWLFMPYVVLFGLAALAVYDLFTAKGYRQPCGPVLITGCDSGFGKGLAVALAALGWPVYAGCLTAQGVASYTTTKNVTAVRMDVTKDEDVHAAMALIEREHPETGMYALVNNAGVDKYGSTDWCGLDHYRWHMEINFFGYVRVAKAALPLLKRHARLRAEKKNAGTGTARIINITSFSGLLPGLPMKSAYGASKHAAESWSNSLRAELRHFGIEVTSVNPSWHRTEIAASQQQNLIEVFHQMPKGVQDDYGLDYMNTVGEASYKGKQGHMWRPENVTKALIRALTAEKYRPQYVVGLDARFYMVPVMMLPRRLINKMYDDTTFGRTKPAGAAARYGEA